MTGGKKREVDHSVKRVIVAHTPTDYNSPEWPTLSI